MTEYKKWKIRDAGSSGPFREQVGYDAPSAAEAFFNDEHDGCLNRDDDGYSQTYELIDAETGKAATYRVTYHHCARAEETQ